MYKRQNGFHKLYVTKPALSDKIKDFVKLPVTTERTEAGHQNLQTLYRPI
jgi:hypothetical protein